MVQVGSLEVMQSGMDREDARLARYSWLGLGYYHSVAFHVNAAAHTSRATYIFVPALLPKKIKVKFAVGFARTDGGS